MIAHRRAVLVGALAFATLARPLRAEMAGSFDPTPGSYRFTRRISRDVAGGRPIAVERVFAVRLRPEGAGWRLDGEQIAVAIDTAPSLEPIAEVERRRIETNSFPLTLDRHGLIASGPLSAPGPAATGGGLEALIAPVEARITRELHGIKRADAQTFLLQLRQAGERTITLFPPDLFRPPTEARNEVREIDLGGGLSGSVATSFLGDSDPASGLMRTASRSVVTQVGDSIRGSRETWSFDRVFP